MKAPLLVLLVLVSILASCQSDPEVEALCGSDDKVWHLESIFTVHDNGDTTGGSMPWYMNAYERTLEGRLMSFRKDGSLISNPANRRNKTFRQLEGKWQFEEEKQYIRYHVQTKYFSVDNEMAKYKVEKLTEDELLVSRPRYREAAEFQRYRKGIPEELKEEANLD